MPTVRVRIAPDGSKAKLEVEGVQGESCTDLTKGIENALLGGNIQQELTDEYYMEHPVTIQGGVG